MNSFEHMGQAQLLAAEGQRLIARAILQAIKRVVARLIVRQVSSSAATPH